MRFRSAALTVIMLGVGAAQAAVPEAVRQLPWRREVQLPQAPPPAGTWYVVEMDSLLAAATRGDPGAMRLVDDAGEPVPVVALDPRWPELFAEPVDLPGVAWTADAKEPLRLTAAFDLLPCDWLRVSWPHATVHSVAVDGAERVPDPPEPVAMDEQTRASEPRGELRTTETWRPNSSRLTLVAFVANVGTTPAVRLERLSLRADRVRSVPFRARPGAFRGATYEQFVDLPAGPHAVLSVTVDRRADAALEPVTLDLERESGGWERSAAAARDSAESLASLGFLAQPILARALRLGFTNADPPNAPFAVTGVGVVPAALAIPPTVRPPLWLVYGDLAVPGPGGLSRNELRAVPRLEALPLGAPQANPWFAEKTFGATWLRRRPLVLTAAMVLVLGIVAAVVVTERGKGGG
jgi:hypothetical protein